MLRSYFARRLGRIVGYAQGRVRLGEREGATIVGDGTRNPQLATRKRGRFTARGRGSKLMSSHDRSCTPSDEVITNNICLFIIPNKTYDA